ncbi:hypothetical protein [Microtetraspora malaysiensis]|uniref:hypothetical protein n=1 Tax=Microtetraspora malaysiensis TaxID=161358 RepID=UPI003D8A43DD
MTRIGAGSPVSSVVSSRIRRNRSVASPDRRASRTSMPYRPRPQLGQGMIHLWYACRRSWQKAWISSRSISSSLALASRSAYLGSRSNRRLVRYGCRLNQPLKNDPLMDSTACSAVPDRATRMPSAHGIKPTRSDAPPASHTASVPSGTQVVAARPMKSAAVLRFRSPPNRALRHALTRSLNSSWPVRECGAGGHRPAAPAPSHASSSAGRSSRCRLAHRTNWTSGKRGGGRNDPGTGLPSCPCSPARAATRSYSVAYSPESADACGTTSWNGAASRAAASAAPPSGPVTTMMGRG